MGTTTYSDGGLARLLAVCGLEIAGDRRNIGGPGQVTEAVRTFIRRLLGLDQPPSQESERFMRDEERKQQREVQERLRRVQEQLAILDRRQAVREHK